MLVFKNAVIFVYLGNIIVVKPGYLLPKLTYINLVACFPQLT